MFAAGFLGSWCYGYLFRAPQRVLVPGALSGGAAIVIVSLCGEETFAGTALAALLVGLIAYNLAPRLKVPVTPLIIPGIITLVPGISAFNAFMAAVSGDYLAGATGMIGVIAYTAAIAIGLSASEQLYKAAQMRRQQHRAS